jgi:hypothetical protein
MRPRPAAVDRRAVGCGVTGRDHEIAVGLQARLDTGALIALAPLGFMHRAASLPARKVSGGER